MTSPEQAVEARVLEVLRNAPSLIAAFGTPPRIYSDKPARCAFPYLETGIGSLPSDEARPDGLTEHRLSVEITCRAGGREEARRLLALVREALSGGIGPLALHRLVIFHAVFGDVFLTRDGTTFRAVLRLRALIDPVIAEVAA